MTRSFNDIAQWSSILGSLFYHDPRSEKGAAAVTFVCCAETAQAWPFGQPEAAEACSKLAKAATREGGSGLHEDFNRMFVGPEKLPAPAWGSVYLDPENVIFGNETIELREWMRETGVTMTLPDREPEDQFGLMLLMAAFCAQTDTSEEALRQLLEYHLLPWAYRFLDQFEEGAGADSFYAAAAQLARCTLKAWEMDFDLTPEPRRLYR